MQALQFRSRSGQKYQVKIPSPQEGLKSAYLFSMHKSGSTLMDNMVRGYCNVLNIPTFSLFNAAFDSGVSTNEVMSDAAICFSSNGRIYTGFRHYPAFDLELAGISCILLVRDPRDMLVSMYYSIAKSHVVTEKHSKFMKQRRKVAKMTIDEFALWKASEYLHSFEKYKKKLPPESLTTYRYEDIIYSKEDWLTDLVNKLNLPMDKRLLKQIAAEFDIFPANEHQNEHIRQVHPGNHRTKLKNNTIDELNILLDEFLQFYGYQ